VKQKPLPARIALSIDEAGAMIGASRWTVVALLERGELPGFVLTAGKRKKTWRIREDALREWIATKEQEAQKHTVKARRLQAIV
jgi:excisionase family DNA binding protein